MGQGRGFRHLTGCVNVLDSEFTEEPDSSYIPSLLKIKGAIYVGLRAYLVTVTTDGRRRAR